MFEECLEVFKRELDYDNNLILDEYIPADGSYIIVDAEGKIKNYQDIKFDKKKRGTSEAVVKGSYFKEICFYDYHSKLISMNKPVDSKKVIHSNNYLSFAVKKESITSKLTETIIDNYYDTLKNPLEAKYKKSKEASKIYQKFEEEYAPVNIEILEKCRSWIKQHIFSIDKLIDIDLKKKDYLKIFFEIFEADEEDNKKNKELFIQEDNRYIFPSIYNNNDYNVEVNGKIQGIPDNNMGMNAKKPFLAIKTRKTPAAYLVDINKAILQKQFFEYLMNFAANGKNNIYIDTKNYRIKAYSDQDERDDFDEMASGYYLRIQKGKELEIQIQDNIVDYQNRLKTNFEYMKFISIDIKGDKLPEFAKKYGVYDKRTSVGTLINEIFFSKFLRTNYFIDVNDMSIKDSVLRQNIIMYRNIIFDWVYKGIDNNFSKAEEKFALDLIKNSIRNEDKYNLRPKSQLNLHWSLKDYFLKMKKEQGGDIMADIATKIRTSVKEKIMSKEDLIMPSDDKEYYYAVGQLLSYFIFKSRAGKRMQSMINPVLNAKRDNIIKMRLFQLYKKYNYDISINNYNMKKLYAMILGYKPQNKVNQEMILFGYLDENILLKSNAKTVKKEN
jgi:CRISPR-associated protein Csh1